MRTPYGLRGEILERFGWTEKYLLWGIPWQNVDLMMVDKPFYEPPPDDTDNASSTDYIKPSDKKEKTKAQALNEFLKSM